MYGERHCLQMGNRERSETVLGSTNVALTSETFIPLSAVQATAETLRRREVVVRNGSSQSHP